MSQFFQVHPENPQPRLIKQAVEILRSGGVIVYPTDSSYAIGCLIGDKGAVERIRRLRQLDDKHNFTLVCSDLSQIGLFAKVDTGAFRLLKAHTPGPYTFILSATREVPRMLLHPKRRTIGLRVPACPIALALLEELGEPLMSVSLILPGQSEPLNDPYEMRDSLEHLVDLVLSFECDRHSGLRLVRATKNRFGPADEVGCFEMTEGGIREVADPSHLFTSARAEPVPGTALTVTQEGRRPLLGELQALVAPSAAQTPRRVTHGLEGGRVSVILAVLERKAKVRLHNKEVYVSTVGGARVVDPAADLAVALAVASAAAEHAFHRPLIALGEVGLSGEVRRVAGVERRIAEAARLGFGLALVPPGSTIGLRGMRAVEVGTVAAAVDLLQLRPPKRRDPEAPRLRLAE